ncbi:hypothetical protein GOX01_22970 [Gluconobacter oxydans]|nr:globin [Gluconobacter oxydans]GEC61966.1 hypothetical protein GOX01_22970 [Gluconobacter oxydans]
MSAPLDDKTRAIISATVPALKAHGTAITTEMYKRLLSTPAIRDLFNLSHQQDGEQPKALALALAVLCYAEHINDLGALGGMVERIAEKHVGLNILPELLSICSRGATRRDRPCSRGCRDAGDRRGVGQSLLVSGRYPYRP